MSTRYSIRCRTPQGAALGTVTNFAADGGAGLEYVLSCAPGGLGVMILTVPATVPLSLFPKDGRLLPYVAIAGRAPTHDNGKVYLIRKRTHTARATTITAYDATSILQRRIIAYYAGSVYSAHAAAAADDQIKSFIRENFGPSISAANRAADSAAEDVSAFLAVQADMGAGASIAKAAAWRNIHEVATDLAQASAALGTYITFEIVAPTESTLEVRTASGQRGTDRRAGSATPLVFTEQSGAIENVVLEEDWTQEITYSYALGEGEQSARKFQYSYDDRVYESPFGRIEGAFPQNTADDLVLDAYADTMLYEHRGMVTLRGDLTETAAATRGIHYDLGDYVTVQHRGLTVNVRLDAINVTVGAPAHASLQLAQGQTAGEDQIARVRAVMRGDISV